MLDVRNLVRITQMATLQLQMQLSWYFFCRSAEAAYFYCLLLCFYIFLEIVQKLLRKGQGLICHHPALQLIAS